MRENMGLYRGKNVSTGEWVYGYLYIRHDGECEIGSYNKEYNIERWTTVVDPATVGRDTGLTDKHGKRIFEGDVVKTKKYGKIVGHSNVSDFDFFHVVYVPCTFRLERSNPFRGFNLVDDGFSHFEVIGNVHDNPELKGDC